VLAGKAMTAAGWIAVGAVLTSVLGLVLVVAGWAMHRSRGLGGERTNALDNVTLKSRRYGRTDRLTRGGASIIPEEWNSLL
jgi:hypothetical protein